MYLDWSAHTGTGNMAIGGLPFASQNTLNYYSAATIGLVDNITTPANTIPSLYHPSSSTQVRFRTIAVGGGGTADIAIDTSGSVIASGHYIV